MRYSREARKEKINLTHSTLIKPDPSIPISQLRKPIRQLRAILVKTSPGEHHLQSRLLPIFLPIFSDEPSKRPRENNLAPSNLHPMHEHCTRSNYRGRSNAGQSNWFSARYRPRACIHVSIYLSLSLFSLACFTINI